MLKSWVMALACIFSAMAVADDAASVVVPVASDPAALKGMMVVSVDGGRLGAVQRLSADGSPEIILDGKVILVPLDTLSIVNGRLMTSLTKKQVLGRT